MTWVTPITQHGSESLIMLPKELTHPGDIFCNKYFILLCHNYEDENL